MLRKSNMWLTPACVDGFDKQEFFFLPQEQQEQLAGLVGRFRQITSTVPPGGPATREQEDQALPMFLEIIQLLEFDRYGDAEAFRLGRQIENRIAAFRPPSLVDLRFNTGLDHSGDPAIWIWAILSDESTDDDSKFFQTTEQVRNLLDAAARELAPERWPYVRFRTVSEQTEILEAQPA